MNAEKIISHLTLEEWKALRYPTMVQEPSEEEGGGFLATIPLLGEAAFHVSAATRERALQRLEELRVDSYEDVIEAQAPIAIPLDACDRAGLPSGTLVVRIDPLLHARLQTQSQVNGVSLNRYCVEVLSNALDYASAPEIVQKAVAEAARPSLRHVG